MKNSVFVWAIVFLGGWGFSQSADSPSKALYDSKCASCHGNDGKGKPTMEKAFKLPPGALSLVGPETQKKSNDDHIALIKEGKGKMPGFDKKISDKEIEGLVSYMNSLGGESKPKSGASKVDLTKAAELYKAKCKSCHGSDGKGNANMTKAFKVDLAALDLVDKATLEKSDQELDKLTSDGVEKMPAFKGNLSETEISSLTAYFRSLEK